MKYCIKSKTKSILRVGWCLARSHKPSLMSSILIPAILLGFSSVCLSQKSFSFLDENMSFSFFEEPKEDISIDFFEELKTEEYIAYNYFSESPQYTYPGSTYRDYNRKRSSLINHLVTFSFHRPSNFSRSDLETRTLKDLENLHNNDHEGRPFVYVRKRGKFFSKISYKELSAEQKSKLDRINSKNRNKESVPFIIVEENPALDFKYPVGNR